MCVCLSELHVSQAWTDTSMAITRCNCSPDAGRFQRGFPHNLRHTWLHRAKSWEASFPVAPKPELLWLQIHSKDRLHVILMVQSCLCPRFSLDPYQTERFSDKATSLLYSTVSFKLQSSARWQHNGWKGLSQWERCWRYWTCIKYPTFR